MVLVYDYDNDLIFDGLSLDRFVKVVALRKTILHLQFSKLKKGVV